VVFFSFLLTLSVGQEEMSIHRQVNVSDERKNNFFTDSIDIHVLFKTIYVRKKVLEYSTLTYFIKLFSVVLTDNWQCSISPISIRHSMLHLFHVAKNSNTRDHYLLFILLPFSFYRQSILNYFFDLMQKRRNHMVFSIVLQEMSQLKDLFIYGNSRRYKCSPIDQTSNKASLISKIISDGNAVVLYIKGLRE